MMFGKPPPPARHPGKMPGGIKFIECMHELQSIYRMMPVTDWDREARAYLGYLDLAPPTMIGDRMIWVEQAYLANVATEMIRVALSTGQLAVWCDYEGAWIELDSDIMFASNKWDRRAVLNAGIYRPMNARRDHGDLQRSACDEATLWVREEDWPEVRDQMIAERERRSGSTLGLDWQFLLDRARRHVSGKPSPVEAATLMRDLTVEGPGKDTSSSPADHSPASVSSGDRKPRVPEAAIERSIAAGVENRIRVDALRTQLEQEYPAHTLPGRADLRRRHKEAWEARWSAEAYPGPGRPPVG